MRYWSSSPQSHLSEVCQIKVFYQYFLFIYSLLLWSDENLKGWWHWGFKATPQHQSQFEHIEIFILTADGTAAYWYHRERGSGTRGQCVRVCVCSGECVFALFNCLKQHKNRETNGLRSKTNHENTALLHDESGQQAPRVRVNENELRLNERES